MRKLPAFMSKKGNRATICPTPGISEGMGMSPRETCVPTSLPALSCCPRPHLAHLPLPTPLPPWGMHQHQLSQKTRLHTRSRLSDLSFLFFFFIFPFATTVNFFFLSNFVLSHPQFHFGCLILHNTFSLTSQSVAMEIRLCNFADGLGRRQKIDCVGNEPTFAKGQHFGHGSTAPGPEEGV